MRRRLSTIGNFKGDSVMRSMTPKQTKEHALVDNCHCTPFAVQYGKKYNHLHKMTDNKTKTRSFAPSNIH